MITPSTYQIILCQIESLLISNKGVYAEIANGINTIKQLSDNNSQQFSTQLLSLFQNVYIYGLSEQTTIQNFLNNIQTLIISQYGDFNTFLANNNILVPSNVNVLLSNLGYSVNSNNLGYCNNNNYIDGVISPIVVTNPINNVTIASVTKITSTDYAWTFSDNFTNSSIAISDIAGMTVGSNIAPSLIVTSSSPILILRYAVSNVTSWQLTLPINLTFISGNTLINASGNIN